MTDVFALISLLSLLLAAWLFTRMTRPTTRVEAIVTLVLALSTLIVLLGYGLSAVNSIGNLCGWMLGSLAALVLAFLPLTFHAPLRARCLCIPAIPRDIEQRIARAGTRDFTIRLLLVMGIAVVVTAILNLVVLTWLEPATLDAFDYHLARIAYYLQQGNLHYFPANYWAQVIYPKVATVLQLYAYVVSGREASMAQVVQFLAYFSSALAIYGIARQLGACRRGSVFAALVFCLLIICLLEAVTAQNDLIMTVFTGCIVYFLLAYRASRRPTALALAGVAFALLLGVKFTCLLLLPSLFLLTLYALLPGKAAPHPAIGKHVLIGLLSWGIALACITLPAGYGDNYLRFHDPLGPKSARAEFTSEAQTGPRILGAGAMNLARYTVDSVVLEGLPPLTPVKMANDTLREMVKRFTQLVGLRLESAYGTIPLYQFRYQKGTVPDEAIAGWGVFGFALICPVALLCLFGVIRAPGARIFAALALLFFIIQAFPTSYDPFRGRFFTMAAVFAVPPLAFLSFSRGHALKKGYIAGVVILGCLAAISVTIIRKGTFLVPFAISGHRFPCALTMSREEQLTRNMPQLFTMVLTYEMQVPKHAVVALDVTTTNYLFFGERATRTLIPLAPFTGEHPAIPANAEFLVYRDLPYQQGDTRLLANNPYYGTIFIRDLRGQHAGEAQQPSRRKQ